MRNLLASLALLTLAFPGSTHAIDEVAHLLNGSQTPAGVVFEIVEGDPDALNELIPRIRDYITRLRNKYPGLETAVVSHGREQFALQQQNSGEYPALHQQVRSLTDSGVPVHICETHAGWYGVSASDFPSYVNVSPAGPVQIAQYEELGWELVRVELP